MPPHELSLQHLTKRFRQTLAVDHLTLTIPAGTLTALLGASGSGKSTVLGMIAGLIDPDDGEVRVGGQSLHGIPPERRGMGLVLQQRLLFPHLSVGENVAFGLKMRGISPHDRQTQALRMLERVQLKGFAERSPASLSGGQAQRVALARALIVQPQVLLLDEPLSALDANLRQDMQHLIWELHQETGVTTLLVTHDQQEAASLASQIAVIDHGKLLQVGSPADCYHRPQSRAVAEFFGGVNRWLGEASGQYVVLEGGIPLTLDHPAQGAVWITIRPELVQVWAQRPSRVNVLAGQVVEQRCTGMQWQVHLRSETGLVIQAWLNQPIVASKTVWIELPPHALWPIPT